MSELHGALVLVTGGNGFLGRRMVRWLGERGADTVCLHRAPPPCGSGATLCVRHDLESDAPLDAVPSEVDYVVHLAAALDPADDPRRLLKVNVLGTLRLLECARSRRSKAFLLASTGGIYGYSYQPLSENAPPRPINLYSTAKYQAELLLRHYARDFATTSLRLFFPYGPGQIGRLIPSLVERIRTSAPITLMNGGRCPALNPVHADDVCRVVMRVIDQRTVGALNVAGPERRTIERLALLLGELIGARPRFELHDDRSVRHLVGDVSLARTSLGFVPRIGLVEGLTSVVQPHNGSRVLASYSA